VSCVLLLGQLVNGISLAFGLSQCFPSLGLIYEESNSSPAFPYLANP
jgi:hypothetical protein